MGTPILSALSMQAFRMQPIELTAQSVVAIFTIAAVFLAWSIRTKGRLPPGPGRGWPYFGTPLKHVKGGRWFLYTDWAKKYGDIVHFRSYGRNYIVLNTYEGARDLLMMRARIYSDRPKMVMARELVGYDNAIALADSTPRTVFMRKAVQTELAPKRLARFRDSQQMETELMLGKLLETPDSFMDHVRIMIAYSIFFTAYGYRPKSDNDDLLVMIKKMMEDFAVFATPGAFLVDNFRFLKYLPSWFPGADFIKFGKAAADRINAVCDLPYSKVKERQANEGQAGISVVASFLQYPDITPEKEHMLRWASEAVFAAGSDTTASAILSFVLAMARNPDVQAKARAELDAWLGIAELKLPTIDDRPQLPYIDKVLLETLRWYPAIPLGLPHRVIEDDVYQGYTIPKDATVVANIWNITHDEAMYPDPWAFIPDRYDTASNVDNSINQDPRKTMFGFGRRQCPGQHLAEISLWIAISSILMVFEILPPPGHNPTDTRLPATEFTPGVISKPLPFKCLFKPRSPKAELLIRTAYADALKKLGDLA